MICSEKMKKIKAVICDVDGVLTDGRVGYNPEPTMKFFHYRDGHWIRLALRAGLLVGLISGRSNEANRVRARELGLTFVYEDAKNKLEAFRQVLEDYHLSAEECLYVGDDMIDYPVMKAAGVGVAVADAVPELDEVADFRTTLCGGHGAVQETLRRLLIEQGKLDAVLERYRHGETLPAPPSNEVEQ